MNIYEKIAQIMCYDYEQGEDMEQAQDEAGRAVAGDATACGNEQIRHAVQFVRWRPDRDPESCTLNQVERAPAYDLDAVLRP